MVSIGTPPWTREEMVAALDEFEELYEQRPISRNDGGMKAPHMFATWFMLRRLAPAVIIESGVWRGQGTWLIEQACPDARIVAIDPDLSRRDHVSDRVEYHTEDFDQHEWPDGALAFFDDHQNAYERLRQCSWHGIHHAIFEDNYPPGQGDCYSLKQVLAGSGHPGTESGPRWRRTTHGRVEPNEQDAAMLRRNVAVYHEFPPVLASRTDRWGRPWDPEPIPLTTHRNGIFAAEARAYTWICYVRLCS